jgi:diacylglycerol kinase family enzyme
VKVGIITNPHSRKNRRRRDRVASLQRLVGDQGIVRQTESLEELRPVLEEFVDRGIDTWICDGGDGAFHWMLNVGDEVLRRSPGAVVRHFVPTNGGTVNFLSRKVGQRGDADGIIRAILDDLRAGAERRTVRIGTLEVAACRPGDAPDRPSFRRLGFGIAIGGIGQRFFSHYYDQSVQGPRGIALLTAKSAVGIYASLPFVRHLPLAPEKWRYFGAEMLRSTRARVVADGRELRYREHHGLHAGAFAIDTGAIRLFPFANEPGTLHFAVGTIATREIARGLFDLARGRAARGRDWRELAGRELQVWAEDDEPLVPFIDGERLEPLMSLEVRPGPAITVLARD